MAKPKLPKSINLLNPVSAPDDVFSNVYDWIYKVGRYVLVLIEVVVLAVFFSRFYFDRINNDLTDGINAQVALLSQPAYRTNEEKIVALNTLLSDIKTTSVEQSLNSKVINSVKENIPPNIVLKTFVFSDNTFNLTYEANDFNSIKDYEFIIRQNSNFTNVNLFLTKDSSGGGKIDFTISFQLATVDNGNL